MSSNSVTVIDIIAEVTDNTEEGASSAIKTVSKLEQSMKKVQASIERMKKMSKIEMTMYAIDKASKVMQSVWSLGKNLAGKVWNVTLKAVDLVTAPVRGIFKLLSNPIVALAGAAGIAIGVKETLGTFMEFEQGMANVKATLGATDTEMQMLSDTAKSFTGSIYSANDAVGVFQTLAGAGWELDAINGATDAILRMATAGDVIPEVAANAMQRNLR